jgi:Glycine-rich domain
MSCTISFFLLVVWCFLIIFAVVVGGFNVTRRLRLPDDCAAGDWPRPVGERTHLWMQSDPGVFVVPRGAGVCRVALVSGGGGGANGRGIGGGSAFPLLLELSVLPGETLTFSRAGTRTALAGQNGSAVMLDGEHGEAQEMALGGGGGSAGADGAGLAGGGGWGNPGIGGEGGLFGEDGVPGANNPGVRGRGAASLGVGNATLCVGLRLGASVPISGNSPSFDAHPILSFSSSRRTRAGTDPASACGGGGGQGFTTAFGYSLSSISGELYSASPRVSGEGGGIGGGGGAGGVRGSDNYTAGGGRGGLTWVSVECWTPREFCHAPIGGGTAREAGFSRLFEVGQDNATSTYNFTTPANGTCSSVRVVVVGGGATGEVPTFLDGFGGSSGQIRTSLFHGIPPNHSIPVTVGAGGRYAVGPIVDGWVRGEVSSFGDYLAADGGSMVDYEFWSLSGSTGGVTPTRFGYDSDPIGSGTPGDSTGRSRIPGFSGKPYHQPWGQGGIAGCVAPGVFTATVAVAQAGRGGSGTHAGNRSSTTWTSSVGGAGGGTGYTITGILPPAAAPARIAAACAFAGATSSAENGHGFGAGGASASGCRVRVGGSDSKPTGTPGDGAPGAVYIECFACPPGNSGCPCGAGGKCNGTGMTCGDDSTCQDISTSGTTGSMSTTGNTVSTDSTTGSAGSTGTTGTNPRNGSMSTTGSTVSPGSTSGTTGTDPSSGTTAVSTSVFSPGKTSSNKNDLGSGAVAGIVIAALFAALCIACSVACFARNIHNASDATRTTNVTDSELSRISSSDETDTGNTSDHTRTDDFSSASSSD